MLPQDDHILLSYINTKLRDEYDSLESLCEGLELDFEEITARLGALGYTYREDLNKFC